jgi:hypothetical protein
VIRPWELPPDTSRWAAVRAAILWLLLILLAALNGVEGWL